ncbi:acido-empty-quinoprotein group A [Granulicella sibirica]|uniref:Glucose dehydrogenase, PQQ-dependent n=1 Tax=Granulicella sibirica TaxID=2479048 RepID=A0A4Q0SU53_9BACT|nr:acido-empty-quinoprotein group A [Granulicella sibirica]RXH54563.1 Glucose dehydrogenase, PQQ-dependent [Granulicella sibirica]
MTRLMKSLMLMLVVMAAGRVWAQDLEAAELLHPSTSWPGYHGDYTGQRHSPLTQITPGNVGTLGLAWAFQTNQAALIKASPLMVDGVIYFTVPDNVWAVDARTGHMLWKYTYPPNPGLHIGNRGVGMYKGTIMFLTPDCHLIALDARNGKVLWETVVADVKKGYWTTEAPLIVGNHVLVGVSGDSDNIQLFLKAIDADTGKEQWRWDASPPAGTPHETTGGATWMTGTYDPVLKLIYWGTGNPTPVLNGEVRPGDNLYTCSIVALDPETGKLVWAFQPSPHDTHDWDAVETPVLVDGDFHGKPTKMLMQSSRNGYFFVLDRTNGKALLTTPFGPVNWAKGIDAKGQPIPDPAKEPAPDGRLIAPDEGGMTNYRSPSFDKKTGLFLVDSHPSWSVYFTKPADGTYGWAGADYGVWGKAELDAIDYQTGKIKWSHFLGKNGAGAGVLTTESGVAFTGDAYGNVLALETATGKTLWHAAPGPQMQSSPASYALDGKQYVLTSSGSVLFAWALPEVTEIAKSAGHKGKAAR